MGNTNFIHFSIKLAKGYMGTRKLCEARLLTFKTFFPQIHYYPLDVEGGNLDLGTDFQPHDKFSTCVPSKKISFIIFYSIKASHEAKL